MKNAATRAHVLTSASLLLAAATALAPEARAQAVTNPNQIVGVVRLATTNAEILDALRDAPGLGEGIVPSSVWTDVTATSIAVVPQLSHSTHPQVIIPARDRASYDLTVESSLTGIRYTVGAQIALDSHFDAYFVESQVSAPVLPDPDPDVVLDLSECVGMLDINWIYDTGAPAFIDGGHIYARRETSPGSGAFATQAQILGLPAGEDRERLVVRGGADFEVEIRAWFNYGSDPELDLGHLTHVCDQTVHVDCDEVERITCVIPTGSIIGGPGCGVFGRIQGDIDMLGEHEHPIGGTNLGAHTMTRSFDGPEGNERWFSLRVDPSSGQFRHEWLLARPAPASWRFEAAMSFGLGNQAEHFTPPALGIGLNPRVPVVECVTTDLAGTYVMDPTHVIGDLFLAGPRRTLGGALFEDLRRDMELNPGAPTGHSFDKSVVGGSGRDVIAPGATHSAVGASATVGFDGLETQNQRNYTGDYDLRLAGLDSAPSMWDPNTLRVVIEDFAVTADPFNFRNSRAGIVDNDVTNIQMDPGATIRIDKDYCFNQVILDYRSLTGIFFDPRLDASGSFLGLDHRGEMKDLSLYVHAEGTPVDAATAADTGLLTMIVPQGDYDVDPRVTSVSPRGIESDTELPPLSFTAGCGQVIRLVRELVPYMSSLPDCTATPVSTITGGFQSMADVVTITYQLNGGTPVVLCTSCGNSPTFTFDVGWMACENEIKVEGVDTEGRSASVTSYTSFDAEPPQVDADAFSVWPPNHRYLCFTNVLDAVRATDNCPGELRYELTSCKSDQPDDAQGPEDRGVDGDGHTSDDCVLADDRSGFCLRAERLGNCPAGRTYSVTVHVTDDCGLSTDAAVRFVVPHEAPDGSLPTATPTFELHQHETPTFAFTRPADPDAGLPSPFACAGR